MKERGGNKDRRREAETGEGRRQIRYTITVPFLFPGVPPFILEKSDDSTQKGLAGFGYPVLLCTSAGSGPRCFG